TGTIAAIGFYKDQDFVIGAADSRSITGETASDDTCKVFALRSGLFFIETGAAALYRKRAKILDVASIAFNAAKEVGDIHDAKRLAELWAVAVENQLNDLTSSGKTQFDQQVKPGSSFVKGVFVSAGSKGQFDAFNTPIIYAPEETIHFVHHLEPIVPSDDGIYVITDQFSLLIEEMINNKTLRAFQVNQLWRASVRSESRETREVARIKAYMQAAIDWSNDPEVHGPIDVIVLRSNGSVFWPNRKSSCASEEESYLRGHSRPH
ncbi:MAG: hypothetical protein WAR24_21260, partial [Candidatus Acidiferrales bacterium]